MEYNSREYAYILILYNLGLLMNKSIFMLMIIGVIATTMITSTVGATFTYAEGQIKDRK
jgi:hypothetical protein